MRAGAGDIELAGLCKSYDGVTNVVDGVNLKIPDGAYCCFLGPSGCGKTTILRMIAGPRGPDRRRDRDRRRERRRAARRSSARTAMMFQSYALFPHLTVRDNVAFALRVRGQSKAERYKAADRDDGKGAADRTGRPAAGASFRAASSSAWRWRARRSPSRGCCCSTSRCRRSTSSFGCRCGRSCGGCSASSASPSSTSPTPSSRRSRSPTSSW